MKNISKFLFCALVSILFIQNIYAQDKRTIETKTADLLAQMPANNLKLRDKLMEEFIALGDEGFQLIANQITPSGQSDNTAQVFALNGLARYTSQSGMEQKRTFVEHNFIKALQNTSSPEVKSFFISQLKLVGTEDAVNAVAPYLTNEELSEPAASVLLSVRDQSAKQALLKALTEANGKSLVTVIKALGELRVSEANEGIIKKLSSGDPNLKKVAFAALAEIAAPESYPVLLNEARRAGFKYVPTDATTAFVTYTERLGETGNLTICKKACDEMMHSCKSPDLLHLNAAALTIYTKYFESEARTRLLQSFDSRDKAYRIAVLNLSEKIKDKDFTEKWIKKAITALPENKAEIITMLGSKGDLNAVDFIKSQIQSHDIGVSEAAIVALTKLKGKEVLPDLIAFLKKGIHTKSIGKALLTVIDEKNLDELISILDNSSDPVKVEIIKITGAKDGERFFDKIYKYTGDSNQEVRKAAYAAMQYLGNPEHVDQLMKLLFAAKDKSSVTSIQDGLVNALSGVKEEDSKISHFIDPLKNGSNKDRIIEILPRIGGAKALKTATSYINSHVETEKNAAINALINWNDYSASSTLVDICKKEQGDLRSKALKGFVRQISNSALPDDQKLLQLRKIMALATSKEEKILIIESMGHLRTFLSLITVANYLDTPGVDAQAAQSAMNIALPSQNYSGLNGKIVEEILTKTAEKLKDSESEYEKAKILKYIAEMPKGEGYVSMFNGQDLSGWQGLVENPVKRAQMSPEELAKKQVEANLKVPKNWSVKDGCIVFNGDGNNLCSVKKYGDFEMIVDWRITKKGDSGIYLRGSPQVQIWDTSRVEVGAQVGSGGLYNNKKNPANPLKVADNPVNEWNTFRIRMVGEKVTVYLNGELVVDNVTLENYWDRSIPIFPKESIELQAHGTDLAFRDIYIKELDSKEYTLNQEEKEQGYKPLFNGKNLDGWVGNTKDYRAENGEIVLHIDNNDPTHGNLYTSAEYSDFICRFEFQLTPGANNGLGIRAPLKGDAAYVGMELQILDNEDPIYANLQPYQYHGSVYGIIPAKRGFLKPIGEWNFEEVRAKGTHITIILNGTTILDGDIREATKNGTPDHKEHPGLFNEKGHIGFLGHGSIVKFRNIRLKELEK